VSFLFIFLLNYRLHFRDFAYTKHPWTASHNDVHAILLKLSIVWFISQKHGGAVQGYFNTFTCFTSCFART